ncbi:hypothetical protein Zmor_010975 [Zophobas morio]|uniref:Uncharacterized protein n=1 Tax=Zophobas morio TaxID=2755281 RepID=A0AA38IJP5_9CUCU|nr:hypothetical protein Zmor_010975 [Zophobas morio]
MKGTREISQRSFAVKSFGRYVYDPDLKSKQIGIKAHGDLNSTPKAVNHSRDRRACVCRYGVVRVPVMCALSVTTGERRIGLDVTADVTLSPKFNARIFIKIICALAGNVIIS